MIARYAFAAALVAAASLAACSSSQGSLGGGDGTGDPGTGDPSGTGGSGGSGGNGDTTGGGGSSAATPPAQPQDQQPPPGVTDNAAKTFFVQKVDPSLLGTCGGCHAAPGSAGAPVYLSSTSASDGYTMVEARGYISGSSSMLLKKGAHEGPALTADQVSLINQWFALELQVRGNQAPVNLLSKLGTCVDPQKFAAIQLQNLRTIKRTNENGNNCTGCNNAVCQTCHQQGEYAMHSNFSNLGQKTSDALVANGTSPEGVFLINKYVTTNGTTLVPSTALADKAKVTQTGTPYSHPMFQISPTMATAITAFANDIITKYNNKQCGQ